MNIVFWIYSQHHACKESANIDVAAYHWIPYGRGAAYPREVSRACDFSRSHGLQTSILFLIPFIRFTCLPDYPLLTLGKDRNQRLLSQPRERLSPLKDSTNAVFSYHRNQQLTAGNDGFHPFAAPCLTGIREKRRCRMSQDSLQARCCLPSWSQQGTRLYKIAWSANFNTLSYSLYPIYLPTRLSAPHSWQR